MDNSYMDKLFDRLIRELHETNKALNKIEKELREQNIALNERQKNWKGDGQDESMGQSEETV